MNDVSDVSDVSNVSDVSDRFLNVIVPFGKGAKNLTIPEKDRRRARAVVGPRHAPIHRERDDRWHLDGEQMLRQGEQPAGRRI